MTLPIPTRPTGQTLAPQPVRSLVELLRVSGSNGGG